MFRSARYANYCLHLLLNLPTSLFPSVTPPVQAKCQSFRTQGCIGFVRDANYPPTNSSASCFMRQTLGTPGPCTSFMRSDPTHDAWYDLSACGVVSPTPAPRPTPPTPVPPPPPPPTPPPSPMPPTPAPKIIAQNFTRTAGNFVMSAVVVPEVGDVVRVVFNADRQTGKIVYILCKRHRQQLCTLLVY